MYKNNSKLSWNELQKRKDVFFFKNDSFIKSYNNTMRYIINKTDLQSYGLYCVLLSHYNTNTKSCFPSLDTLSVECGLSVNTIASIIKKLEEAKIIKKTKGKQGKCNQYTFPLEERRINKEMDEFHRKTYNPYLSRKEREELDFFGSFNDYESNDIF